MLLLFGRYDASSCHRMECQDMHQSCRTQTFRGWKWKIVSGHANERVEYRDDTVNMFRQRLVMQPRKEHATNNPPTTSLASTQASPESSEVWSRDEESTSCAVATKFRAKRCTRTISKRRMARRSKYTKSWV